ncbi:uncharacterized protein TM35_000054620 [Trypanosoma theileri]|uniref:Kinesin motor domain-containing protein n=1 Tax=Trypanosoma theileri TaxID=67003 RepID=A0A1X0P4K5_9TRYP|nr:uncharacterized protein TM35_000054620 [Trypanosoma theileri]ORC91866.1 hypothetical protein TM35_000054620 [Trypanosoma theileri]
MSGSISSVLCVHPSSTNKHYTVVNDTTVELKGDESRRVVVDDVLEKATGAAVWNSVGEHALQAVSTGKQVVVFVSGSTGSGKTQIVRGNAENLNDGLIICVLEAVARVGESTLCLVRVHNDTVQDLFTNADNLKLKQEEGGTVVVNGATIMRVNSVDEGVQHIKSCFSRWKDIFTSNPSVEANSFLVAFLKCNGGGCITVLESCGTEGFLNISGSITPEILTETEKKNKNFSHLSELWVEGATNADSKALNFRETKLGQIIQPGLSAAMEHNGYAVHVVCVDDINGSMEEAEYMISYSGACVKQEALRTVSEYKEIIAKLEENIEENKKSLDILQESTKVAENAALTLQQEFSRKLMDLQERSNKMNSSLEEEKIEHQKTFVNFAKVYEQKLLELRGNREGEAERIRNLEKNAPLQVTMEIKKMKENILLEHNQYMKNLQESINTVTKEINAIKDRIETRKNSLERKKLEEVNALKPIKPLEEEVMKLRIALKASSGRNRESGLTPDEIEKNRLLWSTRDELDDLVSDLEQLAEDSLRLEGVLKVGAGRPEDKSDSDESLEIVHETREQRAEKMMKEKAKEEAEQRQAEEERRYNLEWKHFQETIRRDAFLTDLLNKVINYLGYGTNCTVVTPDGLQRKFIYLQNGSTEIGLLKHDVDKGKVPLGKDPEIVYPISNIKAIHLGQHSTTFQMHLCTIRGRTDPSREDIPSDMEEVNIANIHRYYYRSLSIQFTEEKGFLDFIADTETDFEGWVSALYQITGKRPIWGKRLFIDLAPGFESLSSLERDFCEINHILPMEYLRSKEAILENNRRSLVTLYDIRRICRIDLHHSQKLQECWTKQRWLTQRHLNYFKYQEYADNLADQSDKSLDDDEEEEEEEEEEEDD